LEQKYLERIFELLKNRSVTQFLVIQETISLTFGHGDSILLNEALEYVCPPPLSHDYNYLAEKFSCKIVSGGSKTDGKMGKFHGVIEFT